MAARANHFNPSVIDPAATGASRRRRIRIAVAATGCVAVLSFGVPGLEAASGTVNGAVARVGSASITKVAFRHWLTVAKDATQTSTGGGRATPRSPPAS